uniref:AA_permease_C domain-containing protein n=1 Tax=Macrostomum lignano TaxID=282301 RepID=A0A1I8HAY0_9PLAT
PGKNPLCSASPHKTDEAESLERRARYSRPPNPAQVLRTSSIAMLICLKQCSLPVATELHAKKTSIFDAFFAAFGVESTTRVAAESLDEAALKKELTKHHIMTGAANRRRNSILSSCCSGGGTFLGKLLRQKSLTEARSLETPLKRCLTAYQLIFYGIAHMAGAGIYVLAGTVIKTKAGPAASLSFLLCALLSVFTGLCYVEFSTLIPRAGSCYTFTYITLGELPAFLVGWTMISDLVIGMASVAKAFSSTVDAISHQAISNATRTHFGSLPESDYLDPNIDLVGFSLIIALMLLTLTGAAISMSVNMVLSAVHLGLSYLSPYSELDAGSPFVVAFQSHGAAWLSYVAAGGTLLATGATKLATIYVMPRLFYALAADGVIFPCFAYVQPRLGVPLVGLVFGGLLSAVLALVFNIHTLANFVSMGVLLSYLMIGVDLFYLRYLLHRWGDHSLRAWACCISPGLANWLCRRSTLTRLFVGYLGVSLLTGVLINYAAPLLTWWALLATVLVGAVNLLMLVCLCAYQPRTVEPGVYEAPLMPLPPLMAFFINAVLIVRLEWLTWVRFLVWSIFGLIMYGAYGYRNSVSAKDTQQSIPLDTADLASPDAAAAASSGLDEIESADAESLCSEDTAPLMMGGRSSAKLTASVSNGNDFRG